MKLTFDWNNELRDDGKHFGSTFLKHVENALNSQESVWILLFADTFKENRQIMMVVERHDINFPLDLVLKRMLDGDW